MPDITTKPVPVETGYFLRIYMTALTIYSSERARELTIGQRKCRFYTESNLRHFPVYSYVLCRMDCRANLAKRLCGCLPHFYRKTGNIQRFFKFLFWSSRRSLSSLFYVFSSLPMLFSLLVIFVKVLHK